MARPRTVAQIDRTPGRVLAARNLYRLRHRNRDGSLIGQPGDAPDPPPGGVLLSAAALVPAANQVFTPEELEARVEWHALRVRRECPAGQEWWLPRSRGTRVRHPLTGRLIVVLAGRLRRARAWLRVLPADWRAERRAVLADVARYGRVVDYLRHRIRRGPR